MAAATKKPWVVPAPVYLPVEDANWDRAEDAPGPRCGHSLTTVAPTKNHGPRLILFGGATAIEGGGGGGGSSPSALSLPGIR